LGEWYEDLPEESKLDVQKRFRSPVPGQHEGAFFEIYLHRLFTRMGFELQAHPDVEEKDTHPDYLVKKQGRPCFYLEATITRDSSDDVAERQRADQVFETLEKLVSPDFYISIRVQGAPQTPPPGAKLRKKIESWLQSLNYENVRSTFDSGDLEAMPSLLWKHDDWRLTIEPIPKSPERRGSTDVRAIGMTLPPVRQLSLHDDVKKAVEVKNKYGDLGLPFIVAINVTDEFRVTKNDVMNALFGEETILFDGKRALPGPRRPNGAWYSGRGASNTKISAVMVYPNVTPWNLQDREPWIVLNPWAKYPLNAEAIRLSKFVPNHSDNALLEVKGLSCNRFLQLSEDWPGPDD
jgi:hypothetical protein